MQSSSMRILKYVFLLLFLGIIALTVFVATQKGDYTVKRSIFIKSPPSTVFTYLNDFKNWDQWGFWKEEDPGAKFMVSANSSGAGSSYQWNSGKADGEIRTLFVLENDSISQLTNFDGNVGTYNWKLKDSAGGTKVTWYSKGKLRFMSKIQSAFKGGIDGVVGTNFEKSLANLDSNLDFEINTFNVALNGIVQKPAVKYLSQTVNSKILDQPRNVRIMLSKMREFFQKNKLQAAGKPFVIYHSYNEIPGITKFSVCMPVAEEIFISTGSDMQFGSMDSMSAVKSTLTGDYSHLQKAWSEAEKYIAKNKLIRANNIVIEQYNLGVEASKQPSKWSTEIFLPIVSLQVIDSTLAPKKIIKPSASPTNSVKKDTAN